jgi:hypothetical protein
VLHGISANDELVRIWEEPYYESLANYPSRLTDKSEVVLKKYIFIEKSNKAAHKILNH